MVVRAIFLFGTLLLELEGRWVGAGARALSVHRWDDPDDDALLIARSADSVGKRSAVKLSRRPAGLRLHEAEQHRSRSGVYLLAGKCL